MLRTQNHTDDQQLVKRMAGGDELAFELLFYRYRGKMGHFVRRSLPPQTDLEETVHEVFLRIWINRDKINAQRPFAPYLFRVARNLVIDLLRNNVEHVIYLQDEFFTADFGINETELQIEGKELQTWVQSLMDKLPEKRRNIFILNRFEGLTYPEIARKLNISENTVDTQIRRSLQFFREEIRKIRAILLFFL